MQRERCQFSRLTAGNAWDIGRLPTRWRSSTFGDATANLAGKDDQYVCELAKASDDQSSIYALSQVEFQDGRLRISLSLLLAKIVQRATFISP